MKVDIFNTDKKYNIIYVDLPWEYKESGSGNRVVKFHYPTMSLKELKEMDKKANNRFRKDYTVIELENKFKIKEKEQNYENKKRNYK